ncbi:MAG: 4-hydroxy-tetrahydrodipicolinate synthase [Alphaproteobacteria bacterium]
MTDRQRLPIDTLTGHVSAAPTPFAQGHIDEPAFVEFCRWQVDSGIAALVVNGTTGEAPTLSAVEQSRTIVLAVKAVNGRVPVIAGAGSSETAHAVELARRAERAGADGLLVVTPYYNRPPQEGIFRHFEAVHAATSIPILLYDVPARTGVTLTADTLQRLAQLPRIVGFKDATGRPERALHLRRQLGEAFRLFSGDDATALDFMMKGGNGCISVLANVVPGECAKLDAACRRGDYYGEARTIGASLVPLVRALATEANPIPVKFALSLLGRMRPEMRLPLCEPAAATRIEVAEVLVRMGLLRQPSCEPAAQSRPWADDRGGRPPSCPDGREAAWAPDRIKIA